MAVQFVGKAAVIDAYESRGIGTWAIFQGKNLNYAGSDPDVLAQTLDKLEGSQAVYTLAVYDGIDNHNQLTNRTENNGAFNFKLDKPERQQAINGGFQRAGGFVGGDPIMQEVYGVIAEDIRKSVRERLNGIGQEEPETWADIIKKTVSEKPEVVVSIIGAFKDLLNGGGIAGIAPALLGNVSPKIAGMPAALPAQPVAVESGKEDPRERLAAVLDRLEDSDPDILYHLELLAGIAEKKPAMYRMAIDMLKAQ